ncbi:MAG: AAA family ATPase [Patescibacteria group bacterium]|jgi:hypothetical protein
MATEQGPKPEQKEIDRNKELTPDELRQGLSDLKTEFCTKLGEELGMQLTLPAGTKIGELDLSGKTLAELFDSLMRPLETYEPPIIREEQQEVQEKPTEIPEWLIGHEDLIWKGTHDNPRWQAKATQSGSEVSVTYKRRNKEYKPGKTKEEQGKALEPVENTFTLKEWKVAKQIFDGYDDLMKRYEQGDREARKEFLAILREENKFRRGSGETPAILAQKVEDAVNTTAETTRGFRRDSIDQEALTQKIAELLSQLVVLNATRGEGKERVPVVKKSIKEFPTFILGLEKIAKALDTQLKSNKGLTLIIGEAGTGKNEAASHLAGNTNRPYFWFPCARGMESIELVVHYEFDSKEGTKKFLTDLAEGVQTPGAIVMIDEANALKQEVQAMFHGLGDENRSLNYDGVHIPVAEGVVIIIAVNPATYGSAGNIGQALLSRTRGQAVVMEYPALRKGEFQKNKNKWSDAVLAQKEGEDNTLRDYACDEVQVTRSQFNELAELSDSEFALLWDVVINETTQGQKVTDLEKDEKLKYLLSENLKEHTTKLLRDLRDIERIADTWRKYYEKRAGGMDIIGVSMRDTIAVAKEYKDTGDVRKAYLEVMDDFRKNPIEGLDVTLKALEELIEKTLGEQA